MKISISAAVKKILWNSARIAAVILAAVTLFLVFLLLRNFPFPVPPQPLNWTDLSRLEIHEFDIGVALQWNALPFVLLYLLPVIPYFRRLLQDQSMIHATPVVLLALAAIQLFTQGNEIREAYPAVISLHTTYLVILFGCLLGGWRIGIPLGLLSMLLQGAYEAIFVNRIPMAIQTVGLLEFVRTTSWPVFLYLHFFKPTASAGFWVAVVSCLATRFLVARRYSPLAAMALGTGMVFAVGYWQLAGNQPTGLWQTPAKAMIAGLAAGVLMLMIRNLQVEGAQKRAAAAELSQTRAELRALRAQINPHFFFNALNTIRYMIRTDPKRARALLIDLSEVFQRTLRSGEFVPLRDELSSVEAYLSLEKARLGERLRVVWGGLLPSADPLAAELPFLNQPVPTLALQPIVENAVIHGIGKRLEGGVVSITVECIKNDLVICIEDDGIGMDSGRLADLEKTGSENSASIGLKNVDGRLRMLYGPEYRLVIHSEAGKGTHVTVRIPKAYLEETH